MAGTSLKPLAADLKAITTDVATLVPDIKTLIHYVANYNPVRGWKLLEQEVAPDWGNKALEHGMVLTPEKRKELQIIPQVRTTPEGQAWIDWFKSLVGMGPSQPQVNVQAVVKPQIYLDSSEIAARVEERQAETYARSGRGFGEAFGW